MKKILSIKPSKEPCVSCGDTGDVKTSWHGTYCHTCFCAYKQRVESLYDKLRHMSSSLHIQNLQDHFRYD